MKEDIYVRLRCHLDEFVLGAPESQAILEILKLRFTPEEAEAALLLSQTPQGLEAMADNTDISKHDLGAILDQMANKALVFKQGKEIDGSKRDIYSLLPTAVGLWETSFATGVRNHKTEQLARYWREYYKDGWGKSMFSGGLPFTRVIPVGKALVDSCQEVYSHEQAAELINTQKYICVLHCPCRISAELAGNGCGKPTETCLHFGELARFFVKKGYARELNREEALKIMEMTEEAGLIHMVGNSKEMGVAMCSCCTCCCTQLRGIKEFGISDVMASSRFIANVDTDTCVLCGTCKDRCQLNAISMGDDTAILDAKRCLGCGLCVTTCPTESVTLILRETYEDPVETCMDLGKTFMKSKK